MENNLSLTRIYLFCSLMWKTTSLKSTIFEAHILGEMQLVKQLCVLAVAVLVAAEAKVLIPQGWPMIGFDPTHSGRAEQLPQALMTTPSVKWSYDTEGAPTTVRARVLS